MHAGMSDLPIRIENASVRAGSVTILDRITLSVLPGKPTMLIGPNGSGKSTLIRLCMGLMPASEGRITWGGRESQGERCAMVFQRPVMLRRTAAANIDYVLIGASREQRIGELLKRVGLEHLRGRPARRLSGGEQQRLALARALARDPEVLFLDEPTASLDPAATKAVEDIIHTNAESGIKIVMATHDLGQARRLAGDVAFLVRGKLLEHSPAEKFFTEPATEQAKTFLRGDLVI
jgi:tungstate transport system ATP-binding protein